MTHCIELDELRVVTPEETAQRTKNPSQHRAHQQLVQRAKKLLSAEIDFISNESFFKPDADEVILTEPARESATNSSRSNTVSDEEESIPSDLARICSHDLLSKHEEPLLFQQMNYLKFKANRLRTRLDPQNPDRHLLDRIEDYLASARAIRDRIIQANTRLVMAVVKRHLTPLFTYDEMFSDGILTLLSAVDKFDFDRGFRFSTYAYHSISRAFYRSIKKRHNEKKRFSFRHEYELSDLQEHRDEPETEQQNFGQPLGLLDEMLGQLEKREQVIIRGRFGLGSENKALTLRAIGEKLRLSKERVRQLEQQAVSKMRQFAQDLKLACPFDNA